MRNPVHIDRPCISPNQFKEGKTKQAGLVSVFWVGLWRCGLYPD
jgi:hypothetical protein